jgi:hypothetical protein
LHALLSIVGSIATVALITIATRWVLNAKGTPLPKTRDGVNVYGLKGQWRALGIVGNIFWLVLFMWAWWDRHSRPDGVLIGLTVAFVAAGTWLAIGSVITDQNGITKKWLWYSRSLQWKQITEIRLHPKQGGAIELRAGTRKLVIDFRLNAFQYLLKEIRSRTQMQPTGSTRGSVAPEAPPFC